MTSSLATHIALEDAGADYTAVRIDFASEQQRKSPYLAINPTGRVPALDHLKVFDAVYSGLRGKEFGSP